MNLIASNSKIFFSSNAQRGLSISVYHGKCNEFNSGKGMGVVGKGINFSFVGVGLSERGYCDGMSSHFFARLLRVMRVMRVMRACVPCLSFYPSICRPSACLPACLPFRLSTAMSGMERETTRSASV